MKLVNNLRIAYNEGLLDKYNYYDVDVYFILNIR